MIAALELPTILQRDSVEATVCGRNIAMLSGQRMLTAGDEISIHRQFSSFSTDGNYTVGKRRVSVSVVVGAFLFGASARRSQKIVTRCVELIWELANRHVELR